jgi:hypothetical protein
LAFLSLIPVIGDFSAVPPAGGDHYNDHFFLLASSRLMERLPAFHWVIGRPAGPQSIGGDFGFAAVGDEIPLDFKHKTLSGASIRFPTDDKILCLIHQSIARGKLCQQD